MEYSLKTQSLTKKIGIPMATNPPETPQNRTAELHMRENQLDILRQLTQRWCWDDGTVDGWNPAITSYELVVEISHYLRWDLWPSKRWLALGFLPPTGCLKNLLDGSYSKFQASHFSLPGTWECPRFLVLKKPSLIWTAFSNKRPRVSRHVRMGNITWLQAIMRLE